MILNPNDMLFLEASHFCKSFRRQYSFESHNLSHEDKIPGGQVFPGVKIDILFDFLPVWLI